MRRHDPAYPAAAAHERGCRASLDWLFRDLDRKANVNLNVNVKG